MRRLQPQGCSSSKAGANAGSRPQHRNHRGDRHTIVGSAPEISCRFLRQLATRLNRLALEVGRYRSNAPTAFHAMIAVLDY